MNKGANPINFPALTQKCQWVICCISSWGQSQKPPQSKPMFVFLYQSCIVLTLELANWFGLCPKYCKFSYLCLVLANRSWIEDLASSTLYSLFEHFCHAFRVHGRNLPPPPPKLRAAQNQLYYNLYYSPILQEPCHKCHSLASISSIKYAQKL